MKAFSRFSVAGTALAVVAAVSVGLSAQTHAGPKKAAGPEPAKPAKKSVVVAKAAGAAKAADAAKAAPAEKLTYDGPPVMDPSRYFGAAAMGYAAAKAAPEVMAKLFCYCGCDETDSHNALIDCFTGNHGMDCHICQEEAVLALRMYRDGATMTEIQKRIDADFAKHYPFEKDTAAFTKYKATRLWNPIAAPGTPGLVDGSKEKPKVKPGATVGQCCSDEHPTGNNEKKK
jgi:hypothetical protein